MKLIKNTVRELTAFYKSIYFRFTTLPKKTLIEEVPYYTQWESKNLIKQILNGSVNAKDDPLWKKSGAENKNDYSNWSWNGCGMACLQMILSYKTGHKIPLVKLGQQSLKFGCYKLNASDYDQGKYITSLDGLFYRQFLDFIKSDFGVTGKIISPMVNGEILSKLSKKHLIIASVGGPIYKKRGGHLVLIVGYDLEESVLYINNPSSFKSKSGYETVSFNEFNKIFAGRGIAIY